MRRIFSVLLSIAMIFSIVTGLNLTASANDIYNIQVKGICDYNKANEVLKIVNNERSANGLASLTMDTELLNAAMDRAMETGIYYSHTRPDGSTCFTICNKINGENIAVNYPTSDSVMNGWMNSSGHRANILNSKYKSIGIGCFKVDSGYYWVQSFSNKAAENIPNKSGAVEKTNTVSIQKSLVKLYASASKSTMKINESGYFKYGIVNQGWSSSYCPGVADDYTFSSNNNSVIGIDSNGNFTAKSEGTATLSIALKADSSQKYSKTITVKGKNSSAAQTSKTTTYTNQTRTTKSPATQTQTTRATTAQTKTTTSFTNQTKTTNQCTSKSKTCTKQAKIIKICLNQANTKKSCTNQATVTKLTANCKKKKLNVDWKKVNNACGYEVQIATNKNFKKKNIVCDKSTKKSKLSINRKKIKNCKTCFVRVRSYFKCKDANGTPQKVYSEWCNKVKKVKIG